MSERRDIDWTALKRSLNRVTCVRSEHPSCEYHVTESQAFSYLSKRIRETKETIEILNGFLSLAKPAKGQCDKHWISYCYECSPRSNIDRLLRVARKELASLKFRLISLPTVAEALGRQPMVAVVIAIPPPSLVAPTEHLYGGLRTGNPTQRLRASDLDDNIRLIEAWLRGRNA